MIIPKFDVNGDIQETVSLDYICFINELCSVVKWNDKQHASSTCKVIIKIGGGGGRVN